MSENKEEKPRFATIREMLGEFLDTIGVQCFKFAFNGQCYASNSKGRPARVSIALPKTIVDKNLKDLDNFAFIGVAIPQDIVDKVYNEKKED